MDSPFVTRKDGTSFFRVTREGSLSYSGADNESDLTRLRGLVALGKSVTVLVHLERPGILTEMVSLSPPPAVLAHFGSGDEALLDAVFGRVHPKGRLPFNLPRDSRSVELQMEDVPFDVESPLFPYGYGLVYKK
jgi:beta-glucosidase